MASADIIHWFSRGYGQLEFLADPYLAPIDVPFMAGIISLIVQLYFVRRIWVLCSSTPLVLFIGGLSLAQCVASFFAGVEVYSFTFI